jgi:hypothetical protein
MLVRFFSGLLRGPREKEASKESGMVLNILLPFRVESAFVRFRVTYFFVFKESVINFILALVKAAGFAFAAFKKLF